MLAVMSSLLGIVLAGILSFATATYVSRRETLRRERIGFLLSAYRTLSDASHRPLESNARAFEQALSDIGLLGEPEQVQLATTVAHDIARSKTANLDDLLHSLRGALREELALAKEVPAMPILRIDQ
ncbi:MAG: hypothetical protein QM572_11885 [Nocardioides sp.]|uniref:hypothetical protein n=1 Tax=Nocardioides sp. TaxID=35761 RepID=UPI0039E49080